MSEVILKDLGRIYASGNGFTTKAAILQSKFRFDKGFSIGSTAVKFFEGKDLQGIPMYRKEALSYGHLVADGVTENRNFFFDSTWKYAHERVKNKKKEETIKADRLFNNLLSSMPLAFNLFHPLIELLEKDSVAVTRIIQNTFRGLDICLVTKIDIEFIPTPITNYKNDRSAMDAVVLFKDSNDKENIIAIEVKYTDSLGSNKGKDNEVKSKVAEETKYFTKAGSEHIKNGCMQIYRNFLLTEKYRMVHCLENSYNVILAPKDHPTTDKELSSLKKYLKPDCPFNKIFKVSIEDLVTSFSETVPSTHIDWINWINDRYLAFEKVDSYLRFTSK